MQPFSDLLKATSQLVLMRSSDSAGRVSRVRKFSGHVELRAPAIIWPADAFANPCQLGFELGFGISWLALRYAVPACPEILVFPFQKGRDEIVFGLKMAI